MSLSSLSALYLLPTEDDMKFLIRWASTVFTPTNFTWTSVIFLPEKSWAESCEVQQARAMAARTLVFARFISDLQ